MELTVGDRIVVESERVGQPAREGVVEEVLSSNPLRVRARWDDGKVSIFVPEAGVARVQHAERMTASSSRRQEGEA
jgi:hypothetical protein